MHTATQFHFRNVAVSAKSVGGSSPGVRVTWNATVPSECVTSVRVEFRLTSSHGTSSRSPVVATYTTTNTSQTEIIQTGLQCGTTYNITVVLTGEPRISDGMPSVQMLSPQHPDVQVLVGGKELSASNFNHSNLIVVMPLHRYPNPIRSES